MLPKKNYYLNDYFDIFNTPYTREKEYMKTDIYEKLNHYILEIDLPGLKKENIKFVIVGDGRYKDELSSEIKKRNVSDMFCGVR